MVASDEQLQPHFRNNPTTGRPANRFEPADSLPCSQKKPQLHLTLGHFNARRTQTLFLEDLF
jgi:hypothetical protein